MPGPKPFQIDTTFNGASTFNGALGMACQKAQGYADAARAPATRALYQRARARFEAWCALMHADPLPAAPQTVAAWLAELARSGKSVASIKVSLAAIVDAHRSAGSAVSREHPAIAAVMAGIARRCCRPLRRAAPLELSMLAATIAAIDGDDLRALRDRALLLLGFFAALRRSELVALDIAPAGHSSSDMESDMEAVRGPRSGVEIRPEGLLVHIAASKASNATQTIAVPRRADALCASAALERYLAAAGLACGPLFRPVSKAGRLLARRLEATGVRHILQARTYPAKFSPHALRAGFITSAADAGAPEHAIQATSRHKSVEVLRAYIRAADAFAGAAAQRLPLQPV